ncbi:hypothetical protein QT989_30335 [Microcoleus sp. SVA1_B6]
MRLEVPVVRLEVPVVRQSCHHKIDSGDLRSIAAYSPLKKGV